MTHRARARRLGMLGAALSCIVAAACAPIPIDYMDYEAYVRPKTDVSQYKRVAILYVGFGESTTAVQSEDVGTRGEQLNTTDESRMVVTGSELQGSDVVMYSNALLSAFDQRGVRVIERARVRDIAREQGLVANQLLDMSDEEGLMRLGRMLKVDLLVRGTIFSHQSGLVGTKSYHRATGLSVRGIDTRTGQVVWMETAFADTRLVVGQEERFASSEIVNSMIGRMVDRFYRGER